MISILNAAETATSSGGLIIFLTNIAPFVLIFAVFYFLLIRPQRRKQKEHKQLIENLKAGDNVLLNSGIKAKVTKIKDGEFIVVEIASGVEVEIARSYIAGLINNK